MTLLLKGVINVKDTWSRTFRFKVVLREIEPSIWRQIEVPSYYTFWDLHVAIQDSMGWKDSHLHSFELKDDSTGQSFEIGIPESSFEDDDDILPDWEYRIEDYFSIKNRNAVYVYDFGDYWVHDVILEKVLDRSAGVKYPKCTDGKRACPPEDCGGVGGYFELLEAIRNPGSEEFKEMFEWLGKVYDPEGFDPKDVRFSDPQRRLKNMLRGG